MKSTTGIITSVEAKKQGQTNGKSWTIFEMYVGDKRMSTFDSEYQNHIGETATVYYEERENNGFVNLTAKDFGYKPSEKDNLLQSLADRVAVIEKQLGIGVATSKVEAPANPAPAEDINLDDIPF